MSNNSKSPIILIISAAAVLFIAALVYKQFFQVDNSEKVNVVVEKPAVKSETKKPVKPVVDTYDIKPDDSGKVDIRKLPKEERNKIISDNMTKRIKLRTPEEVVKVIETYQSQGNEEKANEYIDFLLKRFPDYEYKK